MKDYIYRGIPIERHEWIYELYKDIEKTRMNNGFVYGSLIKTADKVFIAVSAMARSNEYHNNSIATLIEVIPSSVGMYMMCGDCNGQFIFEGDIVRYNKKQSSITKYYYGEDNYTPGKSFTVEMIPSIFMEVYHNHYDLEVIGNIHQEVK